MATKFSQFTAQASFTGTDEVVGLHGVTNSRWTGAMLLAYVVAGIPVFTDVAAGTAPASGGGTVNYLRADGTWATPPDTLFTGGTLTSALTLRAGAAGAGNAPLYFQSGTSLTTPVAGAMEFTTDTLSFTITTGAARKPVLLGDTTLVATRIPFATTNGRLMDNAALTFDTTNMRVSMSASVNNGGTMGYTVQATNANDYGGFRAQNDAAGTFEFRKAGSTTPTIGVLAPLQGQITNSTGSTLLMNSSATGDFIFAINGGNEIFRLTGDPSANGGAIARVKTGSTGTLAYSIYELYTTTGQVGFVSAAGSGYTTNGIYSANAVSLQATLQNLNLIAATAAKTVNVATNGTAAANIVATFAGGGTITASAPMLTLAQTWNNSGVTFTGVLVNVTNTASAAASKLQDWQVGGTSVFSQTRGGDVSFNAPGATGGLNISLTGGNGSTYTLTPHNSLIVTGGSGGVGASFFQVSSTGSFRFSVGSIDGTGDLFLSRSAAAILQQGAANAASPVAQTYQAQGSRSGTDSNVAGASLTIRPGAGTGNATPGALIFQSYVAVASGTGAQTATTTLTLNSGNAVFAGSVDAASYKVGGVAGADFGPGAVASITVVKGIVTAIS